MEVRKQEVHTYTEEVPESLGEFKSWEFSSGTRAGKDFKKFARLFRKFVKKEIPEGAELIEFNSGHYILNGFVEKDGKFVYFSISDVRHFKNEWAKRILVRTAEDEEDYTGGPNGYTDLESFGERVSKILSD